MLLIAFWVTRQLRCKDLMMKQDCKCFPIKPDGVEIENLESSREFRIETDCMGGITFTALHVNF